MADAEWRSNVDTVEPFLEVWVWTGSSRQWQDISQYLVNFSAIEDHSRDPVTGSTTGGGFTIIVKNEDGFWFDLEKASGLGKLLNDGDDRYGKTLNGRRVRVGVYEVVGSERTRVPWRVGNIVNLTADSGKAYATLHCETLEQEAREHKCDANSGPDAQGEDFGIRGFNIAYDGEFVDDDYTLYKRKEIYGEDDYSTMIEFHQSVRVNTLIDHIRRVMEVDSVNHLGTVESVLRRAYIRDANDNLVRVRVGDQVQVKDADTFGVASETFGILMSDDQGNFCMVHDDGTDMILTYYTYRNNTWKKWYHNPPGDWLPYRVTNLTGQTLPPATQARLCMWNPTSQRFLWVVNPEDGGLTGPIVYEWDPNTDTVSSQNLRAAPGAPAALGPYNCLCFAPTTAGSANGTLFVAIHPNAAIPPSPGIVLYELDVSNVSGGSISFAAPIAGPVVDPALGLGDNLPPGPPPNWIEWGYDMPAKNMIVYPAAYYSPGTDYEGNNLGTPTNPGTPGLIYAVDRSAGAVPQQDWALVFCDIYGTASPAGTGEAIWRDSSLTDQVSRRQTCFRVNNTASVVIFPLETIGGSDIWFMRFVDADWWTNNTKVNLRVAGKSHGYGAPTGGTGVEVPYYYEPPDSSGARETRFYFWSSMYFDARAAGKLRSSNGDSLRWENQTLTAGSAGDSLFGSLDSANVQTMLAYTLDSNGQVLVSGGFTAQSDPTTKTNWIFMYGYEVFWTLPLLDVRDLSISGALNNIAQVTSYNWYFNPWGALCFVYEGIEETPEVMEIGNKRIRSVNLESAGYDTRNLINSIRMVPWIITMQGGKFADLVEPVQKEVAGDNNLRYIRINQTCDEHIKIKVEITNTAPQRFEVYEYDDATEQWVLVPGGPWPVAATMDDPNGKYTIRGQDWDISGTFILGDKWIFWTYEALYGLEPAGDRFIYEEQDVTSIAKYGKIHNEISDNRFLEKKDLQYVANRLLVLRKNPKKRYRLSMHLMPDMPEPGDVVRFEWEEMRIEMAQQWRVIARAREVRTEGKEVRSGAALIVEELI